MQAFEWSLSTVDKCFICGDAAWNECRECSSDFVTKDVVYFCEHCSERAHGKITTRSEHEVTEVTPDPGGINELDLLSVICIETSHYICFTRSEERWVFFDSMASRVGELPHQGEEKYSMTHTLPSSR